MYVTVAIHKSVPWTNYDQIHAKKKGGGGGVMRGRGGGGRGGVG